MHGATAAFFWGFVGGSALLLGAAIGYWLRVPQRAIAAVMAFGAGVLISALSLELMEDAYARGGFVAAAAGFLGGAALYTGANWLLTMRGAKHRKRSEDQQPNEGDDPGSGLVLAVGALLDGIPESIVIGVSMLAGRGVSIVAVAAVFLSNVPEGLSSSAGMRRAGRSKGYVFGVWGAIAIASAFAALAGYAFFGRFGEGVVAATNAVAAGAILAMIADTMLPEACQIAHELTGIVTVLGFLVAFVLSKLE